MQRALTIFLCLSISVCFGQQVRLQLEAGVNSGGLPKSYSVGGSKAHIWPIVRPAFGVHLVGETKFGLFADVNARFFTTGIRDVFKKNDTDRLNNTWSTFDRKESFTFNRVTYGVGMGYRFPFLKQRLSLAVGYRWIYNLSGNYSYVATYENGVGDFSHYEKGYDPFSDPNLDIQARRKGWELYSAVKFDFTRRFSGIVQYGTPTSVNFTEHISGHTDWDWHGYSRSDMSIAMLYLVQ